MRPSVVFRGGEFVVGVSPFDRSFNLGDGLFETIKVAGGRAVWMEEHLQRLYGSAKYAGIACPLGKRDVSDACGDFIAKEKISEGWLRLTLSRGEAKTGRFSEVPEAGVLAIIGGDAETPASPLRAGFAGWRVNETDPAVSHKTTSRFSSVMAWKAAAGKGLEELVFLNTNGWVAEGIVSNVFWHKGGVLFTPSEKCGMLPGVARAKVMAAAKTLGIRAEVGEYPADALTEADGVFFSNSLWVVRFCGEFCAKTFSEADDGVFPFLRDFMLGLI
ncbi:MAG: aminotransferase class IV [Nitrospinae bacterium]|nr:aminotransferase class IV [Nitrospinota bacterium]